MFNLMYIVLYKQLDVNFRFEYLRFLNFLSIYFLIFFSLNFSLNFELYLSTLCFFDCKPFPFNSFHSLIKSLKKSNIQCTSIQTLMLLIYDLNLLLKFLSEKVKFYVNNDIHLHKYI